MPILPLLLILCVCENSVVALNTVSSKAIKDYVKHLFTIFSVDSKILARDLLADTNIEVSPDGTVSWTAPALFKSSCNINIGKCHG